MKTLQNGIVAVSALLALSLGSCKKDASSPASKSSQLSFQLKADNDASSLATNSTFSFISGLVFTAGTANISQFKLEAKRNGTETEVTSRNLSDVNLFAPSPTVAGVTIDTGFYRQIEIRVVFRHTNSGDLPLKLTGTFTNGSGTVTPIEFDLNDDVTINSEAKNVHVTDTTSLVALVHLHLRQLERGISATDLASATLTDGTIVISNLSNTSIYSRVLANLNGSCEAEFRHHGRDDGDNSGPGNNGDGGNDGGSGGDGGNDGQGHH